MLRVPCWSNPRLAVRVPARESPWNEVLERTANPMGNVRTESGSARGASEYGRDQEKAILAAGRVLGRDFGRQTWCRGIFAEPIFDVQRAGHRFDTVGIEFGEFFDEGQNVCDLIAETLSFMIVKFEFSQAREFFDVDASGHRVISSRR